MKFITIAILGLFLTPSGYAADGARLFCKDKNGEIASATAKSRDGFEKSCDVALLEGTICFTGDRTEALDILDNISIYRGEVYVTHVYYVGKASLAYGMYDQPMDTVIEEKTITNCGREFFE